ncbi:hypothetical protein SAMN05428950_11318 [Sphingomonas sp. OV641]|nr:hypothetical protein SAMN05428950_11318 [Sphingomonas sp. OV641]
MTISWLDRVIGAVFVVAAVSMSTPAMACSCIAPDNVEAAGRAALAKADIAAELVIERAVDPALPRFWCRSDGSARWWFRPGRKIEQSRAARVLRIMKGRVSGPIRIHESPIESTGGYCGRKMNSCEINLAKKGGRTGPMLLRRVAPGMYEPLDVCTQGAFTMWLEQRQKRQISGTR